MRIDWTQTLIGSSAPMPGHSDGVQNVGTWPLTARSTGILASGIAMGLVIALLPMRGGAATSLDLLALSGLLLANVAGLLLARRIGARWVPTLGLLALPFLVVSGMPAPVLVSFVVLVTIEEGLARAQVLLSGKVVSIVATCAGLAGVTGALAGGIELGGVAVLGAALAPIMTFSILLLRSAGGGAEEKDGIAAALRMSAILEALTHGSQRAVLVSDAVGYIDQSGESGFARELAATMFPEGSLVEAVLIADRVAILKALSGAIHAGERNTDLTLRIRREASGAGFPYPPRYEAHQCSVFPMPGLAGRAVVVIEPIVEGVRAAEQSAITPVAGRAGHVDARLLGLALHECTAPFNAGLGFLEMIADPRLAPRDFSTYRDFAAEAHKAISEAHRNTVLLGRWLKAEEELRSDADRTVEIAPLRLVNDALRALNLRDAADRGEIRILGAGELPDASLKAVSARFAVEILLRFGYRAQRCALELVSAGGDLIVSSRRLSRDELPEADALQSALEAAAASVGGVVFGSKDVSERHVRLQGAFGATGIPHVVTEAMQQKRLAS